MTIALAVTTADGVVLATDSRSTSTPPDQPARIVSDATRKIFRVADSAVATYGRAFVGGRSIAGHLPELLARLGDEPRPASGLAAEIERFFGERLGDEAPAGGTLGFLVAGRHDGRAELLEVVLPEGGTTPLGDSATSPGAVWRGQTDVLRRLVKGVDWDLLEPLARRLGAAEAFEALRPAMAGLEYLIPFEAMHLQDAIDFALFSVRATIEVQRFTHGMRAMPGSFPGVGGPIEIAVVTAADGFAWVQRTELPRGGAD